MKCTGARLSLAGWNWAFGGGGCEWTAGEVDDDQDVLSLVLIEPETCSDCT